MTAGVVELGDVRSATWPNVGANWPKEVLNGSLNTISNASRTPIALDRWKRVLALEPGWLGFDAHSITIAVADS